MRFGRTALTLAALGALAPISSSTSGCAASPPPVEIHDLPVAAAPAPAPALVASEGQPRGACEALKKPLRDLRELAALVGLGRSMPIQPLAPEQLAAALDADEAMVKAGKGGDAELDKLLADTGARLGAIAAATRAFAAKRGADREVARTSLLEEMERGELLVQIGARRCAPGAPGEALAGTLRASAIQRVVRAAFPEMKRCYEAGLKRDPSLRGAVRVRFTVARDGSVQGAADADRGPPDPLAWGIGEASPLRDPEVSACVVAAFAKLTFPKPDGGVFSATYPIELSSGR